MLVKEIENSFAICGLVCALCSCKENCSGCKNKCEECNNECSIKKCCLEKDLITAFYAMNSLVMKECLKILV